MKAEIEKWLKDNKITESLFLDNGIPSLIRDLIYDFCTDVNNKDLLSISNWIPYNFYDISSRPEKYGKYFVHRKDGKVHWETWNGIGWAHNGKVITHYKEIKPPF